MPQTSPMNWVLIFLFLSLVLSSLENSLSGIWLSKKNFFVKVKMSFNKL